MAYEQLEEGLYKGEQNSAAFTADAQQQQATAVYGVPAQGYQQGYPVQQPLAGWPAYGAPGAYGTGMPAGAPVFPGQPGYPYPPPPPPVGGGSEDEKYQISDVGVCTIVPGLKAPKYQRYLLLACGIFLCMSAGSLLGLAGWMTMVAGPISIIMWVFGAMELGLAIFLFKAMKKSSPVHHGSIQPEHVQAFIDRVTKIGATLPQLNIIQSLMSQANPNTPHEFAVWKSNAVMDGQPRSHVLAASFGCHNLVRGQKAQQHLFSLVA